LKSIQPAQAEAEGAARWYAERSPGAASAAVAAIEREPRTFLAHEHGSRRVLLRRFPFSVVYRCGDAHILIVAFAHGSHRPGYWRMRV
jgi:hypothetical protein